LNHVFDEAYYRRYYRAKASRIYSQARHAQLVAGVMGMAEWLLGDVKSVLDVGAGLGWWGQWLKKHRRAVTYVSTELEPAICKQYGHRRADVRTLALHRRFDIVVCHGVLPYVAARDIAPAVERLAAHCSGLLYLEAITEEDFAGAVDQTLTDTSVHRHPEALYRKALGSHFRQLGGGLWSIRRGGPVLFALEQTP
jgi:2-polyprenyl-3-methyl-5-hydroxy-6-metoxy-1,4-benzoquinol methylase